MARCFVIQPFDNGKFDKRYVDVFVPAIKAAKLEPYRVDRDPSVNNLLEGITAGIADCVAFLADITTDNPNVWYEFGHAMAAEKPFCICCSEERTSNFPFDISHLSIIKYKVGSSSDFGELETKITERLKAVVTHEVKLQNLKKSASTLTQTKGLSPHEFVALTILFEYQYDAEPGLSAHRVASDIMKAGFTRVAANLALAELLEKEFVDEAQDTDYNGNPYRRFSVTKEGLAWLRENRDRLVLTSKPEPDEPPNPIADEDIPF